MSIPNWDNTFLSSLWVYRKLRGGKWYLRHYKQPTVSSTHQGMEGYPTWDEEWEIWSRSSKKSPFSYVVKMEDYTNPPKTSPFLDGFDDPY